MNTAYDALTKAAEAVWHARSLEDALGAILALRDSLPAQPEGDLWIQYSHLAEGGFGRVMWESDFKELMKRLFSEPAASGAAKLPLDVAVEYGFRCSEKGWNLTQTLFEACKLFAAAPSPESNEESK